MIQTNGEITTLTPVSLASGARTFSVRAQDNSGPGSEMEVHLVCQKTQETNVRRLLPTALFSSRFMGFKHVKLILVCLHVAAKRSSLAEAHQTTLGSCTFEHKGERQRAFSSIY